MDQKPQFSVREYRASDRRAVTTLFLEAVRENIYPSFFRAMSHSDHLGVALSLAVAGYVLGGSSVFQALLFGAAWAGLVYCCCSEIHDSYAAKRLGSDLAHVQTRYLDLPDHNFWVAEVSVNDRVKVVGMASLTCDQKDGRGDEDRNGGLRVDAVGGHGGHGGHGGYGGHGELALVIVAFPYRRLRLGSQLTRTVLDFCEERGLARLVVDVASPRSAAAAMLLRTGFVQTSTRADTHHFRWVSQLARIDVVRMEKLIEHDRQEASS